MKFKCCALVLLISVGSSCNQSASPPPDANKISAAPASEQVTEPARPPATPTGKTLPKPPRMPEIRPEAKMMLENIRAESEKGGSLPKNFPNDVPIYPGAQFGARGDWGEVVTVTLITPDSLDQVQEFYQKALQRQGWKVQETELSMRTLTARKPGRECTVALDLEIYGGGTIVGLTVTPEKKE